MIRDIERDAERQRVGTEIDRDTEEERKTADVKERGGGRSAESKEGEGGRGAVMFFQRESMSSPEYSGCSTLKFPLFSFILLEIVTVVSISALPVRFLSSVVLHSACSSLPWQ